MAFSMLVECPQRARETMSGYCKGLWSIFIPEWENQQPQLSTAGGKNAVDNPRSASTVLLLLGVNFQCCHKYLGFLPNFH